MTDNRSNKDNGVARWSKTIIFKSKTAQYNGKERKVYLKSKKAM